MNSIRILLLCALAFAVPQFCALKAQSSVKRATDINTLDKDFQGLVRWRQEWEDTVPRGWETGTLTESAYAMLKEQKEALLKNITERLNSLSLEDAKKTINAWLDQAGKALQEHYDSWKSQYQKITNFEEARNVWRKMVDSAKGKSLMGMQNALVTILDKVHQAEKTTQSAKMRELYAWLEEQVEQFAEMATRKSSEVFKKVPLNPFHHVSSEEQ